MKKAYVWAALFVFFMHAVYLNTLIRMEYRILDCHKIQREMEKRYEWARNEDTFRVHYNPYNNELVIECKICQEDILYDIYQYLTEKLQDDQFWINTAQCRYKLGATSEVKSVADKYEGSWIYNHYFEGDNWEYTKTGFYMYICAQNGVVVIAEDRFFDDVHVLEIIGNIQMRTLWDLEPVVKMAVHYPNLEKLILPYNELTPEELERLKSVYPPNCVIEYGENL